MVGLAGGDHGVVELFFLIVQVEWGKWEGDGRNTFNTFLGLGL